MRVIRWKNAATGVESLTITATGIYFPVGKTDSSFIARYSMASAGQTASIERVSSPLGDRIGSPSINVSGTTEVVSTDRRGLSSGIAVTAISGTLNAILDDNTPITNWPDNSLGRFPAKGDLDAYVYGATPPTGLLATAAGVQIRWGGTEVGWKSEGMLPAELAGSDTQALLTTKRVVGAYRGATPIGRGKILKINNSPTINPAMRAVSQTATYTENKITLTGYSSEKLLLIRDDSIKMFSGIYAKIVAPSGASVCIKKIGLSQYAAPYLGHFFALIISWASTGLRGITAQHTPVQ